MTAAVTRKQSGVPSQPDQAAARIRVQGLAKRYGALEVFRGIHFEIGAHEIVALVGVLLLAAFGVAFDGLINGSTKRFLPWYRRDENAE